MKLVNIVTYCDWKSYGSLFQALGLQSCLKTLGWEGRVLLPEPEPGDRLQRKLELSRSIPQMLVNAHKFLIHGARDRRYRNTNAFIRRNIALRYCGSYARLCRETPDAEVYLSGSDQVWQPELMNPLFFLDFLPPSVRKISYAASMGKPVIPEKNRERLSSWIKAFHRISVREEDNQALISQLTEREVHRHIDPVFLMDPQQWRSCMRPYPNMDKPYVLVYPIYWDRAWNDRLKQLHQETGLDVVVVAGSLRKIYANRFVYDADPGQFLWLLDQAQMVVTSSFHGVAMSVMFEKKFLPLVNPSMPSRIRGLLEVLGIRQECPGAFPEVDYSHVRERIREEQARSRAYLSEALSGE